MNKAQVLDQAKALLGGDRQDDYGDARENHERIARLWAEVLGVKVEAWQVAVCMGMVKVSRAVQSPDKADTWVDMAAYAAIGGEVSQPKGGDPLGVAYSSGGVIADGPPLRFGYDVHVQDLDAFNVACVPVIEPGHKAVKLDDADRGRTFYTLGEIDYGLIVEDKFGVHHEWVDGVWRTPIIRIAAHMTPHRRAYDKGHGPYTAVARKVESWEGGK